MYRKDPYGLSSWLIAVRVTVKVTLPEAFSHNPSRKQAVSTPSLRQFYIFLL